MNLESQGQHIDLRLTMYMQIKYSGELKKTKLMSELLLQKILLWFNLTAIWTSFIIVQEQHIHYFMFMSSKICVTLFRCLGIVSN